MGNFRFKAYTINGVLQEGTVEASTEAEAVRLTTERGLFPFLIEEQKSTHLPLALLKIGSARDACRFEDYARFTREMSTLLLADLTVDQSLSLLKSDSANSRLRNLSGKLHAAVVSGVPFSEALARLAVGAPAMLQSVVRAGEARGNIGATLSDLAGYLETRVSLNAKLSAALLYPLILLLTALGAVVVVAIFLVPNLMPLFRGAGGSPPTVLSIIETGSRVISAHWPVVIIGISAVLLVVTLALQRPSVRYGLHSIIARTPFFGPLVRDSATSLFGRTVGTLLQAGVPLPQALDISSNTVGNSIYASAIRGTAASVMEGARLSTALEQNTPFSPMAIRFVAVGEETGKLDRMLLKLSEATDTQLQRRIERAMTLVGPLLTLFIGLLVGGLMISVMQALLSVNEVVLQ